LQKFVNASKLNNKNDMSFNLSTADKSDHLQEVFIIVIKPSS